MHASAHWGCTDTVRGSALEDDWKKNPWKHWGIDPVHQCCAWLFSGTLYQLSHPLATGAEDPVTRTWSARVKSENKLGKLTTP